jgi:outer membrane protein
MYPRFQERVDRVGTGVIPLPWGRDFLLVSALVLATMAVLMALAVPLSAQEEQRTMKLSLYQAVELALQKSFDIQIKALDSRSSFANLLSAYSVYDFTLNNDLTFGRASERSITSFRGSQTHDETMNMRISRKIFTGADFSTSLRLGRAGSNSIQSSLNPSFSDNWAVSFTQPVLKGFGKLPTERQIMLSKNNNRISDIDFENQIIATVVDLESRYWDLVSAYDALAVAQDSLELANRQLEINKVKVEVGTIPEIEIIAAEQQVASAESTLVDARAALLRAEDRLKQAVVMDDWQVVIEPTDRLGAAESPRLDMRESLGIAYDRRTELRTLDLQIQNNEISIAYSRNQLLPSLNITADISLYSMGGTFKPSLFAPEPPEGLPLSFISTLTDVFSATNRDWSVGANFTYVLGNSAAKSSLMTNRVQKRQNELRIQKIRYDIAVDIRGAIRELGMSYQQYEARLKALTYAERQLEAEQQKFDVGTSTNFQVLQYQNQLARARYELITAQVRYKKALIDYDRATGTLLEKNNISVQTDAEGVVGTVMR